MNHLGRSLTDQEIDSYDVLPKYLARKVRVISVPSLPGSYQGMTIGFKVFLQPAIPDDGSSSLLAHELVHVRQWAEWGAIGFAQRYLRSFASGLLTHRRWMPAYRAIEAEYQARLETTDWLRRKTMAEAGPLDTVAGHG